MKSIFSKYYTWIFLLFLSVLACKDLDKPEPMNPVICKVDAKFSIINTDFTAPSDVTIQNTTTDASATATYEWDLGNGQTSTDKNPPIGKYIVMKNYTIKLIVKDGVCVDSFKQTISVTDPKLPVISCFTFTASNGAAAPSTVNFDATCSQNGKIFNWDFGDPASGSNSAVGITATHNYSKVGSYDVKLTIINGADTKDFTEKVVILNPPPKPCFSYTASNSATTPSVVSFDASCSTNTTSYNWNFADPSSGSANTATGAKPTHTYTTNGDFIVSLTTTGLGGSKDTSFNVNIKGPAVVSSFTVTNNNCVGPCTVTFTNTSQNATSYVWEFGDGNTSNSTATTVTKTYNTAGTYTVKLTATGPGGTKTSSQSVVIGNGNKAALINVSAISITPLYGMQRTSDGKYHILFSTSSSSSTLYSVIVDKEFKATTPTTILANFVPYSIEALNDGGYLVSAQNTADGKYGRLIKISSAAGLSFDNKIDFNDNTANTVSYAYGVSNLANEEFVLSGLYVNSNKTPTSAPALNTFNKSGTTLLKKRVESTNVENIFIYKLAQTSSGSLIGIGKTWFCWGCTPKRMLVFLTSSGNYSKTIDISTTSYEDIIRIGTTNNYLLFKNSGKIRAIDANGTQVWEKTVVSAKTDIINAATTLSDGSIVVCGKKSDIAYVAKFNSSGTLLWEKTYPQKAIPSQTVISYATSVKLTSDGGLLITGGTYVSGVNDIDLYLIKTDKDGNIQ